MAFPVEGVSLTIVNDVVVSALASSELDILDRHWEISRVVYTGATSDQALIISYGSNHIRDKPSIYMLCNQH